MMPIPDCKAPESHMLASYWKINMPLHLGEKNTTNSDGPYLDEGLER